MPKNSQKLAETLRQQIVKALATGLWAPGAKLPSTREMAAAMKIDPRVAADAYRELSTEGLVELRSRSGAYISETARPIGAGVAPSEGWLADVLADGIARELRLTDLAEWLRRATETLRLKAFVIAPTHDQVEGLRREVLTYYGIETGGQTLNELHRGGGLPLDLRRADLLITTEACRKVSSQISVKLGLPCICVVGSDDLAVIPDDGVVYVTQSAREKLGGLALNGRILPSARVLSRESSHELTTLIVEQNLAAVRSRQAAGA